MSLDQSIWAYPDRWPRKVQGYIFLAQAVQELGGAMSPDWTGSEVAMAPLPPLPPRRSLAIPSSLSIRTRGSPGWEMDAATWDKIVSARDVVLRGRADAVARLKAVQETIADAIIDGSLVYAVRDEASGRFQVGPPESWNVDRWRNRFVGCWMNLREPNSVGYAGAGFGRLFLEATSFARLVAKAGVVAPVAAPSANELMAWQVKTGEQQQAWIWREDVLAEATRRGATLGAPLYRVLAAMAAESGLPWTADAIGATYRRTRTN